MKKFLKKAANVTLAVIMSVLVAGGIFIACGDNNSGNKEPLTPDVPNSFVYYTVSFDSLGGTVTESQKVEAGKTAKKPKDPVKSAEARKEYVFIGWYFGEDLWDFENTAVTADLTLTARYKITEYSQEVLPSK